MAAAPPVRGPFSVWPSPILKSVVYLPVRMLHTTVGGERYPVFIPGDSVDGTWDGRAPYGIFLVVRTIDYTQAGKIKIAAIADGVSVDATGGLQLHFLPHQPLRYVALKVESHEVVSFWWATSSLRRKHWRCGVYDSSWISEWMTVFTRAVALGRYKGRSFGS